MTQRNSNAVILKPAKRKALRWLRIVLAGVALLGVGVAQHGKDRKVSPDLDGDSRTAALKPGLLGKIAPQMVDVIVQFRHPLPSSIFVRSTIWAVSLQDSCHPSRAEISVCLLPLFRTWLLMEKSLTSHPTARSA
jgi:hypothetical protein